MAWEPTIYSLLGFGAAATSAVVTGMAWRNRTQRGARSFQVLMLALGAWSLIYAIQLGFGTPSSQLPWQRAALAIGGTVPTLWLLFAVQYAGWDDWLTRGKRVALAVEPLLFALLTFIHPVHELIWTSATLTPTRAGPVLNLSFTPVYYSHIAYAYLLVTIGLALLVLVFERTTPVYRRQTGFLILGVLPPFAANILYTLRVPWGPLPAADPTPFVFILTGVLWALALFRFDLLQRTPMAQQQILDEMGDGLIVLDAEGRVVRANTPARNALEPSPDVGHSISDVGPETAETVAATREALDGRTITATVDGRERVYDVEWSSLTDDQWTVVGHMIALRDVTDRNDSEQRLQVAQRMLRHNLRNDMTVIQGWADQLAETATDDQVTAVRRINETAEDLIELSEKTRTMVGLEAPATTERRRIDVRAQLTALVADFAQRYPDITIEYSIPDSVAVILPDEKFLLIPVENVIENAIKHNEGDDPWVEVRTEVGSEQVRIHVADNGPPIPEMEREVLENGEEDALQHGSGLGLWLTYWSVTITGGRIEFADRDPRGNIVTLEWSTV